WLDGLEHVTLQVVRELGQLGRVAPGQAAVEAAGLRVDGPGHDEQATVVLDVDPLPGGIAKVHAVGQAEPHVQSTGPGLGDEGGRQGVAGVDRGPGVQSSTADVDVEDD